MHEIRVPSLAENVTEATVGMWNVDDGDTIAPDDGVAELITEKASFTLTSEGQGAITILVPEKSTMPVGCILALLDATPENISNAKNENETLLKTHAEKLTAVDDAIDKAMSNNASVAASKNIRATPAARRLAKEHALDLAQIAETVDGIIKDEHIHAYLEANQ